MSVNDTNQMMNTSPADEAEEEQIRYLNEVCKAETGPFKLGDHAMINAGCGLRRGEHLARHHTQSVSEDGRVSISFYWQGLFDEKPKKGTAFADPMELPAGAPESPASSEAEADVQSVVE